MNNHRLIAYFSMEIALHAEIPTYSGGLGILAGDTLRSMADLKVPVVGVSLLHRKGYFYQRLDATGNQTEEPAAWVVSDFLQPMKETVTVTVEGRPVNLRAWKYEVAGCGGFTVPVILLDSDLPENADGDRTLTHFLYGGDARYRFCQEILLGIGGVRMLRALGYHAIERFHMNEGHASLLALELLDERLRQRGATAITPEDIDEVKERCVFTTHTPVPAGHDQFPLDLVRRVLGNHAALASHPTLFCLENRLNMTFLALNLSHYVNGVAKKHRDVSRAMFPRYEIHAITNGVHAATWVAPSFRRLYDRLIPGWREDNFSLRYALNIPPGDIWEAHQAAKRDLIHHVNRETNAGLDFDVLTLGFARRATTYKRPDMMFSDVQRLRSISAAGALQIVLAGKAHPQDQPGKELIRRLFRLKDEMRTDIRVVYLPNYDMDLGRLMTAGVDVWLNTPEPPMEASGTSGMKAALNGVPSLSVLDGWWLEGCIEGVTGWAIGAQPGDHPPERPDGVRDAASLYDKLEHVVVPLFHGPRDHFIDVMRHAIALNGSFFNTQRMAQQYVVKAYFC